MNSLSLNEMQVHTVLGMLLQRGWDEVAVVAFLSGTGLLAGSISSREGEGPITVTEGC